MIKKLLVMVLALIFAFSVTACGKKNEEAGTTTTITGMVVSVEGTVLTLVQTENMSMGGRGGTERPSMPEGSEGMDRFSGDRFDGTLPEGETFPEMQRDGERPELPEGETFPEMEWDGEQPALPEGETMPEMPEGMPESGEQPDRENMPAREDMAEDMETTEIDISGAHISVEIDGGKATGSMEDITEGCFVTITMNEKGEVTNVLVSASGFRKFSES